MDNGMTPADIMALTSDKKDDSFLGGNGILALIIVFILLFGNGGFGLGGNNSEALTRAEMQSGFVTNSMVGKLDGLSQNICNLGYENAQLANQTNANITNLGYMMKECCCELKTEGLRNTQAILDRMCEDKIETLQSSLNSANSVIAQNAQTQYILGQLGRFYTYPAFAPCNTGCGCGF